MIAVVHRRWLWKQWTTTGMDRIQNERAKQAPCGQSYGFCLAVRTLASSLALDS